MAREPSLSIAEYFLRLYRAEAEVLCRECEDIIAENASIEAQIASAEARNDIA